MNIEKIVRKLEKLNYDFETRNNRIIVKLGYSHHAQIEINENKIEIKDRLKNWNFLTGVVEMSLKSSIVFNTFLILFSGIMFFLIHLKVESSYLNYLTILIFLIGIFWILLWTMYFLIKFEFFKNLIESIED